MAASLESLLLALNSTGTTPQANGPHPTTSGSLWKRAMQHYVLRRKKKMMTRKKMRSGSAWTEKQAISKNKHGLQGGPKRSMTCVERRTRALQRLVPGGEAMGLAGLFREAADYIACLKMQAQVMKIMIKVLSGESDD